MKRSVHAISSSPWRGERVLNRLRSLARLIGREPVMLMG